MIDLIGKRYYFFVASLLFILAGVYAVFFVNHGLNLDIQFRGGTVIEMQMNDANYDTIKVEQVVTQAINKKVSAQKSTTLNAKEAGKKIEMLIINIASKDTLTGDELSKAVGAVRNNFSVKTDAQMTVRNVNPSIGSELKIKAINSVIITSICIIIYIWVRFAIMSGFAAGVTAVLALLHDAAIMMAVYTIFNIPINESFIAAVLTMLGYSMNDTIIIYDRIRENSDLIRKYPISELVNRSIIQTLSRTINTTVTVLISIITVYVFAYYNNIASVKEFSFPLIVGIASGSYSSIFIASPLLVMWRQARTKKKLITKAAN